MFGSPTRKQGGFVEDQEGDARGQQDRGGGRPGSRGGGGRSLTGASHLGGGGGGGGGGSDDLVKVASMTEPGGNDLRIKPNAIECKPASPHFWRARGRGWRRRPQIASCFPAQFLNGLASTPSLQITETTTSYPPIICIDLIYLSAAFWPAIRPFAHIYIPARKSST